jgi:hypothetical protein
MIDRHIDVAGGNPRDDPSPASYWAAHTTRKLPATVDRVSIGLLVVCGGALGHI